MSGDMLAFDGTVLDFQHDVATVECSIGGQARRVLAKRAGRLAKARIFVFPGDRVRVLVSPLDLGRGRIVERFDRGRVSTT